MPSSIKPIVKNRMPHLKYCFIMLLSITTFMAPFSLRELNAEMKQTKKDEPIDIKSDRMISYNKKDLVSFIGNVVAVKKRMTIYADKMDVYTEGESRSMNKIISTGKVKIILIDKDDPGKRGMGRADKAVYEKEKNLLTLIGNASVKNRNNIIEGDKIIYNIDKESMVSYGKGKNRAETIIFATE